MELKGGSEEEVRLVVKCEELRYVFGFARGKEHEEVEWVGEVSTDVMTADPPVGAPFTGMLLGVYAFGEMEPCSVPADFRYAKFSV